MIYLVDGEYSNNGTKSSKISIFINRNYDDDADLLIVQQATAQSRENVTIVSKDIDVLVLLTALCPSNNDTIILLIQAFAGCDTTSAFLNRRKLRFAKICEVKKVLQNAVNIFLMSNQDSQTICQDGATCLFALYGATMADKNLNQFP